MRVLITGAGGLLGPYLLDAFRCYDVFAINNRIEFNLLNIEEIRTVIDKFKPEIVIHAAAETNVDNCEGDFGFSYYNRDITYNLVSCLSDQYLVYISTDQVYPDTIGPHSEITVGPVNGYGYGKLAAEKVVSLLPSHLILRTNFFGPSRSKGRKSFSDWVIESLTIGPTPSFFNDVLFNPLHMKTLSATIEKLVDIGLIGTFNVGASSLMSKSAFAWAVAEKFGLLEQFNKANITKAAWKVPRPHDMTMDISRIERVMSMPSLEQEIGKL